MSNTAGYRSSPSLTVWDLFAIGVSCLMGYALSYFVGGWVVHDSAQWSRVAAGAVTIVVSVTVIVIISAILYGIFWMAYRWWQERPPLPPEKAWGAFRHWAGYYYYDASGNVLCHIYRYPRGCWWGQAWRDGEEYGPLTVCGMERRADIVAYAEAKYGPPGTRQQVVE